MIRPLKRKTIHRPVVIIGMILLMALAFFEIFRRLAW
jgi:hypothetical protein